VRPPASCRRGGLRPISETESHKAVRPEGRTAFFRLGGFTLIELLVVLAIVAVLAVLAAGTVPDLLQRAERTDALAKTRTMGQAVLKYPVDHEGKLPPLFPGQVLEYEAERRGRIVTECAAYLGLPTSPTRYIVRSLMPRAYARQTIPADQAQMRVWVMNTRLTNNADIVHPFGRVTTPGEPPTGNTTPGALSGFAAQWMMTTADQQQLNVATAPWRVNTPDTPPLHDVRAVFRFDGSAGLVKIVEP
jgi:prepilin-type N-terminal cleavage/methylation domain-containing protein